ncbi:hypothetical protein METH_12290 [Leisingera methylohalidivorans DSM 14336]|uniref:Uncharacterized protein n=1 Tax=Leisingera methylohalidivorans DSM 14336 TaxID=999552 RepID=V9VZA7_9RHOB|nr:hypothetical protein METH_12290 [Leisingera methylohalidivorans DSM 14336]
MLPTGAARDGLQAATEGIENHFLKNCKFQFRKPYALFA